LPSTSLLTYEAMEYFYESLVIYVTGFEKTVHVRTRIEIHLIAYCNSHTRVLSRHNNKIGLYKFFTNGLLSTLSSHEGP